MGFEEGDLWDGKVEGWDREPNKEAEEGEGKRIRRRTRYGWRVLRNAEDIGVEVEWGMADSATVYLGQYRYRCDD